MKTTKIEKNYFSELVDDFGWVENVPSWAISYLVNGDATGLSESEIAECDAWYADMQANGMLDFAILRVNDKGEYTDDMNCSVASGFFHYPSFGEAAECEECLIITDDWNEKLSSYHKKMKYIEDNGFDAIINDVSSLNYGEKTYNVFFANDYGYKVWDFLVDGVDSDEGALEEVSHYCSENNLADNCYIFTYEQFEELCKAEFGEYPNENNDTEFSERLDMMYFDPMMYFDTVHLGFKEVKTFA